MTRYQHLATLLAERIEQGLSRGEIAVGAQLKSGARRQY